jgi:hypothetical protein
MVYTISAVHCHKHRKKWESNISGKLVWEHWMGSSHRLPNHYRGWLCNSRMTRPRPQLHSPILYPFVMWLEYPMGERAVIEACTPEGTINQWYNLSLSTLLTKSCKIHPYNNLQIVIIIWIVYLKQKYVEGLYLGHWYHPVIATARWMT